MPKQLRCVHPAPGLGMTVGDEEVFPNARAKELLNFVTPYRLFVLSKDLGDDESDKAPEGEPFKPKTKDPETKDPETKDPETKDPEEDPKKPEEDPKKEDSEGGKRRKTNK